MRASRLEKSGDGLSGYLRFGKQTVHPLDLPLTRQAHHGRCIQSRCRPHMRCTYCVWYHERFLHCSNSNPSMGPSL